MIYILIPVHNRKHFTIECVKCLLNQCYDSYRIIVIDDGSNDGTSFTLQELFPDVIILKGDGNLWWTGSINLGVRYVLEESNSLGDFILTLNNDLVVDSHYLDQLLQSYCSNQPCIVGSVTVDIKSPEVVTFCGNRWNKYNAKYRSTLQLPISLSKLQEKGDVIKSDLLPGRGTLIPKKVFLELGLYDQKNFPHYMADEDFSLQASKLGYTAYVSTKAVVFSHVEQTGLNQQYKKKNLRYWYEHFFSIKSACNLNIRYRWARKNGNSFVFYYILDLIRVLSPSSKYIKKKL